MEEGDKSNLVINFIEYVLIQSNSASPYITYTKIFFCLKIFFSRTRSFSLHPYHHSKRVSCCEVPEYSPCSSSSICQSAHHYPTEKQNSPQINKGHALSILYCRHR